MAGDSDSDHGRELAECPHKGAQRFRQEGRQAEEGPVAGRRNVRHREAAQPLCVYLWAPISAERESTLSRTGIISRKRITSPNETPMLSL